MPQFIEISHATPQYVQCVALRDRVLRKPLGLAFSAADLQAEADQRHFALIERGPEQQADVIVGCVIAVPVSDTRYKLRQMAIAFDRQGEGLGRELLRQTETHLAQLGANEVELHARDVAVGFYEKLGYETVGLPFVEVSIPHQAMRKRLG